MGGYVLPPPQPVQFGVPPPGPTGSGGYAQRDPRQGGYPPVAAGGGYPPPPPQHYAAMAGGGPGGYAGMPPRPVGDVEAYRLRVGRPSDRLIMRLTVGLIETHEEINNVSFQTDESEFHSTREETRRVIRSTACEA